MAWVAVVCISMTEPQGYWAAELALEVYVFRLMDLALSDASPHSHRWALSTNKLFRLEFSLLKLVLLAVLQASEVRLLAFEAAVVCEFVKGEFLKFVIEGVS